LIEQKELNAERTYFSTSCKVNIPDYEQKCSVVNLPKVILAATLTEVSMEVYGE